MTTVVLRGGQVLDGTGRPPFTADVAVQSGSIIDVGDLQGLAARDDVEVVDITGQFVAPGFVDVHSHSDLITYLDPDEPVVTASVRQGVTTEITGNCGWTPFPAAADRHDATVRHLASVFGKSARAFASLADYRTALEDAALPVNFAPLVGHGALRAAAVGFDRVAVGSSAAAQMARLLDEAFDHGAFGLSSGLVYPPAVYSTPDELVALAGVAARRGRLYTTHLRNETELVLQAADEAIDAARRTGVPVQISHVKVAGRSQWGKIDTMITRLAVARKEGLDVAGDVYPYTAGSTLLRAILPTWANEGGVAGMTRRLRDPAERARVAQAYEEGIDGWQNWVAAAGWDGISIASAPDRVDIEGRTIAQLAAGAGVEPADMAADLLVELGGEVVIVLHMMAESDVQTLIADPAMLIGSDTIPLPGKPHPRTAGTFARVLGHYVREQRLAELADMVRRMTSVPAQRFSLGRRGVVDTGWVADLAVFDPATVADRATYDDPLQSARGVAHVLIGGQFVIRDGTDTGRRPGRVLEPA